MTTRIAFRLDLPHGRCVGVEVPALEALDAALADLHPGEQVFARTLPPPRQQTWAAGRLALRAALADLGIDPAAILATDRGAPSLPDSVVGSISHKRHLAVALARTYRPGHERTETVGIDLEADAAPRTDIGRRVLTADEQAAVAALPVEARGRATMLRFSAKEALYKALDPFVRRYVAFTEAAVAPRDDGTATVTLALKNGEGPFAANVGWVTHGGHLITTATVTAPFRDVDSAAKLR